MTWPLITRWVIVPIRSQFRSAENQIVRLKSDLDRISRNRLVAYRQGRIEEATKQSFRLLETELKNVEALASYVKTISPAAAREIIGHHLEASRRFKDLRIAGDVASLQSWLKEDLAPLVNKSEQAAHLVATSVRLEKGKKARPFAWGMRKER